MNKSAYCYLLLCLIAVFPAFSGIGKAPMPSIHSAISTFVIEGATIWDGSGGPPIRDGVVVVSEGRIQSIGPRSSVRAPVGGAVIQAKGKTLIPGLINAHGHVGMTKGLKAGPENYGAENLLAQLRQYARYGVTTVQSLGTDFEAIF
jgi:predicted amidohydrolase YtcJ